MSEMKSREVRRFIDENRVFFSVLRIRINNFVRRHFSSGYAEIRSSERVIVNRSRDYYKMNITNVRRYAVSESRETAPVSRNNNIPSREELEKIAGFTGQSLNPDLKEMSEFTDSYNGVVKPKLESPFRIPRAEDYAPLWARAFDCQEYLETITGCNAFHEMCEYLDENANHDETLFFIGQKLGTFYTRMLKAKENFSDRPLPQKTPENLLINFFRPIFNDEFNVIFPWILKNQQDEIYQGFIRKLNQYLKEIRFYTYNEPLKNGKIEADEESFFNVEIYSLSAVPQNAEQDRVIKELKLLPYMIEYGTSFQQKRLLVMMPGKAVIYRRYI